MKEGGEGGFGSEGEVSKRDRQRDRLGKVSVEGRKCWLSNGSRRKWKLCETCNSHLIRIPKNNLCAF